MKLNKVECMDPKEFREKGFLQELNRQFLYPLGLAIEMNIVNGVETLGRIWDYRNDPEGLLYPEEVGEAEEFKGKMKNVKVLKEARVRTRQQLLGFVVQFEEKPPNKIICGDCGKELELGYSCEDCLIFTGVDDV